MSIEFPVYDKKFYYIMQNIIVYRNNSPVWLIQSICVYKLLFQIDVHHFIEGYRDYPKTDCTILFILYLANTQKKPVPTKTEAGLLPLFNCVPPGSSEPTPSLECFLSSQDGYPYVWFLSLGLSFYKHIGYAIAQQMPFLSHKCTASFVPSAFLTEVPYY